METSRTRTNIEVMRCGSYVSLNFSRQIENAMSDYSLPRGEEERPESAAAAPHIGNEGTKKDTANKDIVMVVQAAVSLDLEASLDLIRIGFITCSTGAKPRLECSWDGV